MPKLPDASDLGTATPSSGRSIRGYSVPNITGAGAGLRAAGAALQDMGGEFAKREKEEKDKLDKIAYSRAQLEYLKNDLELQNRLEQEPDISKRSKIYSEGTNEIRMRMRGALEGSGVNPELVERFAVETESNALVQASRYNSTANDYERADFTDKLVTSWEEALALASGPNVSQEQWENVSRTIFLSAEATKGLFPPGASQKMVRELQIKGNQMRITRNPSLIDAEILHGSVNPSDVFDKAILHTESRNRQFDKNGKPLESPKGAIGIAQVMPDTGPEAAQLAGLPWDENKYRNDRDYNAAIGKAYFLKQYETFGAIDKAMAAYNAGPGSLRKAMAEARKRGGNWYDYLPEETQKYIAQNNMLIAGVPSIDDDGVEFIKSKDPIWWESAVAKRKNEMATEAKAITSSVRDRLNSGYEVAGDDIQRAVQYAMVAGDAEVIGELENLNASKTIITEMTSKSPAEIERHINEVLEPAARQDGATDKEFTILQTAKSFLNNAKKQVAENAMEYAVSTGALQNVNTLSIEASPADVLRRDQQVNDVASMYGGFRAFYTEAELDDITNRVKSMNPVEQVEFFATLRQQAPKNYMHAIGQIAKKTNFDMAYVGGLATHDKKAAENAAAGMALVRDNPKLSKKSEIETFFQNTYKEALRYYLMRTPQVGEAIMNSADGLLASGKTKDTQEAINMALGVGDIDNNVIPPVGTSYNDFADFVEKMDVRKAIVNSETGRDVPVRTNGEFITEEDLRDASKYRIVAPNQYIIIGDDNLPLYSQSGTLFVLNINKNMIGTK